jgi:hypothetical protein
MIAITTSSSTSVTPDRRSGLPQTHEPLNRMHAPSGWPNPHDSGWLLGLSNPSTIDSRLIYQFIWSDERIDHIAGHGVTAEEVEQVCFGRPLVLRAKSQGRNPIYYCLGQTQSGRYLFCVVIAFPDGNGFPVTARPMTAKETRRYLRWRNR